MGIFSRAMERKSTQAEIWAEMLGKGGSSKAGPAVNLDSAFKVSVAFACIKVLSQGIAQVPFKLYRESTINGLPNIAPEKTHALYDIVTTTPNDWTTSFEFRETLAIHAVLGNAYAFINRGLGGRITELVLLDPSKVEKKQSESWEISYEVMGKSGAVQKFPAEAIWHVRGPSWNGYAGMDVVNMAKEALGLAIATEETHSKLHAKGVKPSGTYSVDGNLSPDQYKQLKTWIEKEFAGAENSGAPMILDRGAKWMSQSMTGLDAQHLETRKFQIEEICRFFGVMPIMVGYSDKSSTFASAEAFFDAHVRHSLAPWYARIEQSADAYLLTKKERADGLYFKFIAAGLLRGAAKDRAEYYSRALGSGGSPAWMAVDEIRALEELNPMGGDAATFSAAKPAQPAMTGTP